MTNPHSARTGLARIVQATGYSIDGFAAAYRGESAFRQEVWAAAVLLPLALWVGRSWVETALLMGTVLLVLIVELLNSGIEAAIDRVSLELHELSKRAKDFASAAVFLSLALCGGVWLAALWQRLAP
jgi:diacylglycerol kinase (ATP)